MKKIYFFSILFLINCANRDFIYNTSTKCIELKNSQGTTLGKITLQIPNIFDTLVTTIHMEDDGCKSKSYAFIVKKFKDCFPDTMGFYNQCDIKDTFSMKNFSFHHELSFCVDPEGIYDEKVLKEWFESRRFFNKNHKNTLYELISIGNHKAILDKYTEYPGRYELQCVEATFFLKGYLIKLSFSQFIQGNVDLSYNIIKCIKNMEIEE